MKSHESMKRLTVTALLLAMNIIMSMSIFSLPVPGGHMYLNDLIIVTAAILLEPFYAFMVGGVGAFIGDFLFYPAPMFVSLVTHGLQALFISVFCRRLLRTRPILSSAIASAFGTLICVIGYTLGRAFIYSTPAYALMKLPFQFLQTLVGSALALLLCWKLGLVSLYRKEFGESSSCGKEEK